MPWEARDTMSLRLEFVEWGMREGANLAELCRRYKISRKTGYKWLERFKKEKLEGLKDKSRRPHHSPKQSKKAVEDLVSEARQDHPAWGARKIEVEIGKRVAERGISGIKIPASSTIHGILKRQGLIKEEKGVHHQPYVRFEREEPNELWQMDFKGHFALRQGRCHPLTVLDDHSRFCLCLKACENEGAKTVQESLTDLFCRYGLPYRILCDNGAPWGSDWEHRHTILTVWLMQLGVRVTHGRPYHPQTQGKDERFHRTLTEEVLRRYQFRDHQDCQKRFDPWRELYNHRRPHHSLGMQVPASRYRVSSRSFPERVPEPQYEEGWETRKVDEAGVVYWRGKEWRVGKAFRGQRLAFRPTSQDGKYEILFYLNVIKEVDIRAN